MELGQQVRNLPIPLEGLIVALLYFNIYGTTRYTGDEVTAVLSVLYNVGLVVFAGFVVFHVRGSPPRVNSAIAIGLFAALVAYYASTIVWSPSTVYASWKAVRLLTVVSTLFAGSVVLFGGSRKRARLFFLAVAVAATLLTVEVFYSHFVVGRVSNWQLDANYIMISRLLGAGILSTGYLAWRIQGRWRALPGVLGAAMAVAMLQTGARGPIVALGVGGGVAIAWLAYDGSVVSTEHLVGSGAFAMAIGGIGIWTLRGSKTVTRFTELLSLDGLADANGRAELFGTAIHHWLQSPVVGHGIGSFGPLYGGEDVRLYPHNVLLELGVEAGLVGVVLFLGVLAIAVLTATGATTDDVALVAVSLGLFVYMFVNSMVTGDVSTNRALFVTVAVLFAFDRSRIPWRLYRRLPGFSVDSGRL